MDSSTDSTTELTRSVAPVFQSRQENPIHRNFSNKSSGDSNGSALDSAIEVLIHFLLSKYSHYGLY
jgi:hypothetical protein